MNSNYLINRNILSKAKQCVYYYNSKCCLSSKAINSWIELKTNLRETQKMQIRRNSLITSITRNLLKKELNSFPIISK